MHGDDGVPVLVGHVEQHPVSRDARVVDHDVQAALLFGGSHQAVGGRALADVAGDGDRRAAGGVDLVDHVAGGHRVLDVVDHHRGTGLGQTDRFGAPQAPGGTGHHGNSTRQIR